MLTVNDDKKEKWQSVTVTNSLINDISDMSYCEGYGYTVDEALEEFKERYTLWKNEILEKIALMDKQLEEKNFVEVDYSGKPLSGDNTDKWKSIF